MLEAWLDFHRQTLLMKCSGLTAEQLRRRAAPPSSLSLLGLVRHMAEVERAWFRRRVAGEDVAYLYSSEADPDGEFDHVDTADPDEDFATYLAEQLITVFDGLIVQAVMGIEVRADTVQAMVRALLDAQGAR